MTIALTLVALRIVIGARVVAPSGAESVDRATYSVHDVLDLIESVGVECAAPLIMTDRDDGVFGSCKSDPRLDLLRNQEGHRSKLNVVVVSSAMGADSDNSRAKQSTREDLDLSRRRQLEWNVDPARSCAVTS